MLLLPKLLPNAQQSVHPSVMLGSIFIRHAPSRCCCCCPVWVLPQKLTVLHIFFLSLACTARSEDNWTCQSTGRVAAAAIARWIPLKIQLIVTVFGLIRFTIVTATGLAGWRLFEVYLQKIRKISFIHGWPYSTTPPGLSNENSKFHFTQISRSIYAPLDNLDPCPQVNRTYESI